MSNINNPEVTYVSVTAINFDDKQGLGVSWSAKGIGFGEITLFFKEGGGVEVDHEHMTDQFVITVLSKALQKYTEGNMCG